MYEIQPTKRFQKDVKRIKRRGYNLALLTEIINRLAAGETLPTKHRDHGLSGEYSMCRECHITPD